MEQVEPPLHSKDAGKAMAEREKFAEELVSVEVQELPDTVTRDVGKLDGGVRGWSTGSCFPDTRLITL